MMIKGSGHVQDEGPGPLAMHAEAVRHLKEDLGPRADLTGLELVHLIRMLGYQYDRAAFSSAAGPAVTGPRWRLLLRLRAEEQHPSGKGMSPGDLSRCQEVSKNTISTLLRGLEEDQLVERALDSEDRRSFRIRLTPRGRELIRKSAPARLGRLNELISDLSAGERKQLVSLLTRLHQSVVRHTQHASTEGD
jgi:DNA-binding MarR family transcriptional regulator